MKADWKDILKSSLSEEDKKTIDEATAKQGEQTSPLKKQRLRIELDKRQKGKLATLVVGFDGSDDELKQLAKTLKTKCGSGGSFRDGEILIQGDVREKVGETLTNLGHSVRII